MAEDPNLGSLQQQIAALESRLAGIERRLGLSPSSSNTNAAPKPSDPASTSFSKRFGESPITSSFMTSLSPITSKIMLPGSQTESGNWLGVIAVACFVLAAAFIIKLSIETGWLTPARQVGLATLFGLSLIGSGLWLRKSDRQYASYLPAAGIVILYLSVFGAHRYYSMISFEGALFATSAISALCIWLYKEMRHDLYALTAAVGSYVAPIAVGLNTLDIFSVYYYVLCSIAFATVSIFVNSRTLSAVAAYLAISTTAYIGFNLANNELIACALAFHFGIFAIGTALQTYRNRVQLTEGAAFAYFPVLVLFYAMEYIYIGRINPDLPPWCALGSAAFLVAVYVLAKRLMPHRTLGSRSVVIAFVTLACFHSGYLELMPGDFRPWLFSFIILTLALTPAKFLKPTRGGERVWMIPRIAVLAILGIEYVSMVFKLFDKPSVQPFDVSVLTVMAGLSSLWFAIVMMVNGEKKLFGDNRSLLVAAHILAILGFYNLVHSQGSLAVSAAWLLYAVAVMAYAFKLRDEVMAKSALAVLGLAAAKALLYDASSAPTVVRIICLLLTGAVLYGAGLLMRRISNWKQVSR